MVCAKANSLEYLCHLEKQVSGFGAASWDTSVDAEIASDGALG